MTAHAQKKCAPEKIRHFQRALHEGLTSFRPVPSLAGLIFSGRCDRKRSAFKGTSPFEACFKAINTDSPKLPLMAFFYQKSPLKNLVKKKNQQIFGLLFSVSYIYCLGKNKNQCIMAIMPKKSKLNLPPLNLGEEAWGKRIARLRKQNGLSQAQLAKKIGKDRDNSGVGIRLWKEPIAFPRRDDGQVRPRASSLRRWAVGLKTL